MTGRTIMGILLVLGTVVVLGCGGERATPDAAASSPEPRERSNPPVVLISIDTLRSDRLPAYGYEGVDTPAIDRLRRDGILYRHAYAPVPLTLPSHTSLLTGLLPPDHGVRENMGYTLDGPGHPSLARTLREEGYRTAAAVSTVVLRSATGISEGFDVYRDEISNTRKITLTTASQRPGGETLEAIDGWLREAEGGDEPFFLFFHIYEPHRPLEAPEPFASRYPEGYDAEVAAADAVVGRLLDRLRDSGVYDRALVVLVSDHGEGLMDHEDLEHGLLLYREVLQVPLIVKLPGGERRGTTVDAPAQLLDVFPTVLDVLGLERPQELAGTSLLDLPAEPRPVLGETYVPRIQFGWSDLASVILYPHHLIWGPDPELYDLARDPGETRNILSERRAVAHRLGKLVRDYRTDFVPPGGIPDETRRELAALGYLGGTAGESDGPLPDPKTRIHIVRWLGEGFEQYRTRDFPAAIETLRRALAEEPEIYLGWLYLGNSLMELHRPAEALSAYEKAMNLTSGAPSIALSTAGALADLGRYEEARTLAETATDDFPEAYDTLVQIALADGDVEGAREYLDRALEESEEMPGILVARAEVLLAESRYRDALEATREAEDARSEEADPETYGGLFVTRGKALANLGQVAEAEAAFLREIELNPRSIEAYKHLALLYALAGDAEGAGQAIGQLLARNPSPTAALEAARTLRTLGDPGSADQLLERARERWPDDPRLRRAG